MAFLESNSFDWWSTYTTTSANSATWMLYPTTYTTVCANSGFWQNNISVYNTYNTLSSKWISTNETLSSNLQKWNDSIDEYNVYSNRVQEYTKQKTFSAVNLYPSNTLNITWNLSSEQVAIYNANDTSHFMNFTGGKKGGIYNLFLFTNAACNSSFNVSFNRNKFKFPNHLNTYSASGTSLRNFQFLCDGPYLHGKQNIYDLSPPESDRYYSGSGILLFENDVRKNFISFEGYDTLFPVFGGGVIVVGNRPYIAGSGIIIQGVDYNNNYVFIFNTLSASYAIPPYDVLGSQDRININNPNLSATNVETPSNTIEITRKCETYSSIDIITKAYGYISELYIDDIKIDDYVFKISGYENHETGHSIYPTDLDLNLNKNILVKFGEAVPLTPTLSSGISLWVDAMDYSSFDFEEIDGKNYITGLSSKIFETDLYFTSVSSASSFYNINPKQSINYNLSSTHYISPIFSEKTDFLTFTVLTPSVSSSEMQWLWANGDYGIFKIPNKYSLGIGTSAQYHEYNYGFTNRNIPHCIATRCLSSNNSQAVFINSGNIISLKAVSANFDSESYTMLGGYNPDFGYSKYSLHEYILFEGSMRGDQISRITNYLVDKWNILFNVPIETPTPTPTPSVTPTQTPTPTPTPINMWILRNGIWNDNNTWYDSETWNF